MKKTEWQKRVSESNAEKEQERLALRRKEYYKTRYEQNKEKVLSKLKEKYWKDPEKWAEYEAKKRDKRKEENPQKYIHSHVKSRCKSRGDIPFTISPEDIVIPKTCPLLGIPIHFGTNRSKFNSPTLDRKDNNKGYVKDNVWVISMQANIMKSSASFEELRLFCTNMLRYLDEWQ